MLGKHAVAVNTGRHLIRVLNEGYRRWKFVSSVVSDSQISFIWYRRYLMAAIQLAASCGEVYFSRCCALKRTGNSRRKVRLRVFILTEFKK